MPQEATIMATTTRRLGGRQPLQHWLMFTGVTIFGAALLWQFGLLRLMVRSDHTYISSVIVLLYLITTVHCLTRTLAIARESESTAKIARRLAGAPGPITLNGPIVTVEGSGPLPPGLLSDHIGDLVRKAETRDAGPLDQGLLLRVFSVRLRGSNALGGFASDTMMKLGLVGTIIGFIVMLAPIAGLDPSDRGAIKSSMSLMSDGMAIAMYTTLAGLVGSILVKIQYYMLEASTGALLITCVRLLELEVVPTLERAWNRPV